MTTQSPNSLQTNHKIKDKTFIINHWKPRQAYQKLCYVGSFFAASAGAVVAAISQDDGSVVEVIPLALNDLMVRLNEDTILEFLDAILGDTYYEGQPLIGDKIDEAFLTNPAGISVLVMKVMEINLAPLLTGEAFEDLMAVAALATSFPQQ